MINFLKFALAGFAAGSLVACATEDESVDPVSDDTVFVETTVNVAADGTFTVSEPHEITAGKQRAQAERRLAIERGELDPTSSVIADDPNCPSSSLWLYATTTWSGSRICFTGGGGTELSKFKRYIRVGTQNIPVGTWEIASGSFWPGQYRGSLEPKVYSDWNERWVEYGAARSFSHAQPAWFTFIGRW